ncbi:MAG TPA: aldolase/citrate lyase family protein [Nocardioidaceae bacterium]|nr:aldolase/citrate lyase family protein [Nocardioidaceae bacterium]
MSELFDAVDAMLAPADADLAARYPGERSGQPVHTVYVPADRYDDSTVASYGEVALSVLDEAAHAVGAPTSLITRVRNRLETNPIDDLRIDFEDGYGFRDDDVEDADVRRAARSGHGIRFKSLEKATRARGLRTLSLFLEEGGSGNVTLPKVTSVAQVEAMVVACEKLGLDSFEIQIETPQSVLLVTELLQAAQGRCSALHFGTYDYTASLGIAAAHQSLDHPAADHAKSAMQLAAAGTGVWLSDGSTNVLPVGEHAGDAWRLHARLVRRSLERGFYQGWDLHPAQLPTRFLATFGFYREGFPLAAQRLHAYLDRRDSGFLDEPATAVGLSGFLLRGIECGALDAPEVGLDIEELGKLARRA